MSLITDVLVCLNDQRREAGLAPLTSNSLLMQTARQHAEFMNAAQVLSHGGENRSTFEERIRATGYRFTAAAENVAKGAVNADGVVRLWMDSPPHRANILNPNLRDVGLGISPEESEDIIERYWSLSLAAPAPPQGA